MKVKCHCCKRLGPIIFLNIKNISGRSGVLAAKASYRDTKKKKKFKLAEMISCLMYDRKTSQSCAQSRDEINRIKVADGLSRLARSLADPPAS